MINEMSNSLADRMVNLSPEVRNFCEENSRKIAGDPPRFQTMADAWVFAVLEGIKSGTRFEGEMKKTKDAFRWRVVRTEIQGALLLKAYIVNSVNNQRISLEENSPGELISLLERFAHSGILSLGKT